MTDTDTMTETESRLGRYWGAFTDFFSRTPNVDQGEKKPWLRRGLGLLLVLLAIMSAIAWYWSREPKPFWVDAGTAEQPHVVGYATVDTLIRVAQTLLDKPGGYLSNDIAPPSVFLDNIPSWEFGALVQVRDLAKVVRNDYSRSQSQSMEDTDLAKAEPLLSFNSDSWILPRTEAEYRRAIGHLIEYRDRLGASADQDAQFYARADNLREWLELLEKRLGGYTQQLTASVGQRRVNTNLAGDPSAANSSPQPGDIVVKTPWHLIDNVFFEARGASWALIHLLRAAEFDFAEVLEKKNATTSLRQIIRELEASQQALRSPVVLNGWGFGLFANHSLVMASYLARANSAVINLRELLAQG